MPRCGRRSHNWSRRSPNKIAKTSKRQSVKPLKPRRTYLDKLISDTQNYLEKLSDLEIVETKLIRQTEEYADYVDERVLWIRSAPAFRHGRSRTPPPRRGLVVQPGRRGRTCCGDLPSTAASTSSRSSWRWRFLGRSSTFAADSSPRSTRSARWPAAPTAAASSQRSRPCA